MEYSVYRPTQPITIELIFKSSQEVADLLLSLQKWTPTGGWSELAQELFQALSEGAT